MGKDLRTKANLNTVVLEGDMSHSARVAAVQSFRDGTQDVLVATDVAARGLDVLGVTHVFNYSLGISIESYVHRCGRTGRAGRFGVAHTFVTGGDERLTPEAEAVRRAAHGSGWHRPAKRGLHPAEQQTPHKRKFGRQHTRHTSSTEAARGNRGTQCQTLVCAAISPPIAAAPDKIRLRALRSLPCLFWISKLSLNPLVCWKRRATA